MKKLLLLSLLLICFISCKQQNNDETDMSWDSQNIRMLNNADDSMFTSEADLKGYEGWSYGYKRLEGTTGVIGKWDDSYRYGKHIITLNTDGTFNYLSQSLDYDGNVISERKKNGKYELYIENEQYYIKVYDGNTTYDLPYRVSNKYFCHPASASPV